MKFKRSFFLLFYSLILTNNSFAEQIKESTVPPIKYPEKKYDESQFRREIINSFFNNEATDKDSSNMTGNQNYLSNEQNKRIDSYNNSQNNLNINLEKRESADNLEKLMEKNVIKKKAEIKKKNLMDLPEKDSTRSDSEIWKVILLSLIFIGFLFLFGFFLIRFKKQGLFSLNKSEKTMEVVSTLSISPKRQVIILRIRDQEIAVSNTENGITFLTEIGSSSSSSAGGGINEKRALQISEKYFLPSQEKKIIEKIEQKKENSTNEKSLEKKSDILLKALKSINANSLNQKKNKQLDIDDKVELKSEPFPKYLASQFENEAKKEVRKKEEEVDSVENVTNLIREKLRSMKPLN
ncbi:flagellar biosynthetic protein FliO [Spirobacillus cienkowskii]|uniref:flagellar biosynthetic protein FliO n=1 Tax=Spirobacillus cienkowskii TaxID=495820 RepID=UPI0030CFE8B0